MIMTTWGRRIVRTALAVCATAALAVSLASPATAATARNGVCESGEFCLYWGLRFTESVSDFNTSIPVYGESQPTCYEFKGDGRGQGTCVWHNAASAKNLTGGTVRLYMQESCVGAERWVIRPGIGVPDLSPHVNWNESHSLASSGEC